jgi:NAD(P)-dependent dehydrogenase (short-subunit alcohol dehydrogenase family)
VSSSNASSRSGPWTPENVPSLAGRRIVVTGANSGIGLDATRIFASKGARVILACRSTDKGERARDEIVRQHPEAHVEVRKLDLASLSSVQKFADDYLAKDGALDVLVNNAGVMALPRSLTEDGFEMQFGTNHLGHFALTARLFAALDRGSNARVVNVSSLVHKSGSIRFDDLHGERSYGKWSAYSQSKLANLLFTYELDRRLRAANSPVIVAACHPGYANTNLQYVGPQMEKSSFGETIMRIGNKFLAQPAELGALPTVYAAVADDVHSGDFIGPDGFMEIRGYPKHVQPASRAKDSDVARRLWDVSEKACKIEFAIPSHT